MRVHAGVHSHYQRTCAKVTSRTTRCSSDDHTTNAEEWAQGSSAPSAMRAPMGVGLGIPYPGTVIPHFRTPLHLSVGCVCCVSAFF